MRRSLGDSNFDRNQSGESDGFESNERIISQIVKASSLRSQDSHNGLGRPNPVRRLSRPGSANGHAPSIVMLTSADHADATRYTLNPIFRSCSWVLYECCVGCSIDS